MKITEGKIAPAQRIGTQTPNYVSRAIEAFKAGQAGKGSMAQAEIVPEGGQIMPSSEAAPQPAAASASSAPEAAPAAAPQAPAQEAPAPEVAARSRELAMRAQREKALRAQIKQQQDSLAAKEAAIAAKEAALAAKEQEYLQNYIPKSRLSEDPLSVLAEANVSYDTLTQQMLNPTPTDPRLQAHVSKLEQQLQQVTEQLKATEENRKAQEQAAYDNAVKQIETNIKRLVSSEPQFEAIKAARAEKDVVDLIKRVHSEEGVILTEREACEAIEEELTERIYNYAKLEKIQKRLQPGSPKVAAPAPKLQAEKPAQEAQPMPQAKTLTNALSSTRKLSSTERAILAFKGQLK